MSAPRSHGQPSPTLCAGILIGMLAMIIIPAAITLHSVRSPVTLVPTEQRNCVTPSYLKLLRVTLHLVPPSVTDCLPGAPKAVRSIAATASFPRR